MRLIIIDSDPKIRDFFKNLGMKMDLKVEVVDKTAKALFHLKNPQDLSLVFLGNGGNPFSQSVAACQFVNPNIPIFLMVKEGNQDEIKRAYLQGIRGVVTKPILRDKIADLLQEVQVIEYFKSHLKKMAQKEGCDLGDPRMDEKVRPIIDILREAEELEIKRKVK